MQLERMLIHLRNLSAVIDQYDKAKIHIKYR